MKFWLGVGLLLGSGAAIVWPFDASLLDWQPSLFWTQPWRCVTGAWVHLSRQHLVANLGGLLTALVLGWAARLPARAALAWLLAWPLTQLGLMTQPQLLHYGGLSGVVHAAVAITVLHLLVNGRRMERIIGVLLGLGLLAKLILEQPFASATQTVPGWDIALAPVAHVSGSLAGLLAFVLCEVLSPKAHAAAGKSI